MDIDQIIGFADPADINCIAEFYQYYTNGNMSISQAAKDYGISGLTAAFYVRSFQQSRSKKTKTLTLKSSI